MTVLVIGSNGFIGSNLVKDNYTGLTRQEVDCTDQQQVDEYFCTHTYETVIHCAVIGGSRLQTDGQEVCTKNILMFENVARHLGTSFAKLIYFSSGAALRGNPPTDPYGLSKWLIDKRIEHMDNAYSLRIWGCYGPGELETRFSAICQKDKHVTIPKDGYFDFVSVEEIKEVVRTYVTGEKTDKFHNFSSLIARKLSDWAEFFGATCTIEDTSGLGESYINSNEYKYILSKDSIYYNDLYKYIVQYSDYINKFMEFKCDGNIVNLTSPHIDIHYKQYDLTLTECSTFEIPLDSFYVYLDVLIDKSFKDKLIFDCGACCGLDALLFAKHGAKHVISLEPDNFNYELLRKNCKGYENTNTLINKALFNHENEILFSNENAQGSMIIGKNIDIEKEELIKIRKAETCMIKCTTINELVHLYGKPDIIKIDIEGSEYDLPVNNSMGALRDLDSIEFIVEIHGKQKNITHYENFIKYLTDDLGYKIGNSLVQDTGTIIEHFYK